MVIRSAQPDIGRVSFWLSRQSFDSRASENQVLKSDDTESSAIMKCPYCREDNDRVIDSRACEDGFAIRRRRECASCGRRYTTYERLEESVIKVIKKDGARTPFDREKIRLGLEKACWKRPISAAQIEETVTAVENHIFTTFDTEVPSRDIGELVMRQLGQLDNVAFVRFASVYREFEDVRDFVDELGPMLGATKPTD
jgi:transcriptional repressor NrdR